MMKRETFVSILGAALAEADAELCSEARNLLQARERTLRQEAVQGYEPGQRIEYTTTLGRRAEGKIAKLNRFSVTIHEPDEVKGYRAVVVPVERIVGEISE